MRSLESYLRAAMERAMKVQEVMLQAMAKKITWFQAAEIIGISDRHMRRWRERYEEGGFRGLFDRRARQAFAEAGARGGVGAGVGSSIGRSISILICGIFTRNWPARDLPPRLVYLGDGKRRKSEVVGKKLEPFASFHIEITHAPQRIGIDFGGVDRGEDDGVVRANTSTLIHRMRVAPLQQHI
jgi:hypothetical protein